MIGRVYAYAAALLAGTSALVMPQLVLADSGGAPLSGGGSPSTTAPATPPANGTVQPGTRIISASRNGITITSRAGVLFRKRLRFSGHVSRSAAGHLIEIDRLGPQTHGSWTRTARGRIRSDGSFSAVWSTNHTGRFAIRAVILRRNGPRATPVGSPTLSVVVYKLAIATTYGPGFYGSQTACGEKLTRTMLGTANRTLKCGTRVAVLYRGRSIVVPVIDRGPYANGADWDLTVATAKKLGIDGTAKVGAAPLR